MSQSKIRILLADDHTLVRRGIAQLLSMEDDMEVVGEAADGIEVYDQAKRLRPDLILLDLDMPRCTGLEALVRIKHDIPEACVVVLTYSAAGADAREAVRMGAQGYLLKNMEPEALCGYIRSAILGETPIAGQVARNLLLGQSDDRAARQSQEPSTIDKGLTGRELEIVDLMAAGATNREIGVSLFLSEHTVKNHVKHILEKLKLQNRTQVATWASTQRAGR